VGHHVDSSDWPSPLRRGLGQSSSIHEVGRVGFYAVDELTKSKRFDYNWLMASFFLLLLLISWLLIGPITHARPTFWLSFPTFHYNSVYFICGPVGKPTGRRDITLWLHYILGDLHSKILGPAHILGPGRTFRFLGQNTAWEQFRKPGWP